MYKWQSSTNGRSFPFNVNSSPWSLDAEPQLLDGIRKQPIFNYPPEHRNQEKSNWVLLKWGLGFPRPHHLPSRALPLSEALSPHSLVREHPAPHTHCLPGSCLWLFCYVRIFEGETLQIPSSFGSLVAHGAAAAPRPACSPTPVAVFGGSQTPCAHPGAPN